MDDAASNQAQLHAVISGHVQGVGFRYFVLEQAQRLGLTGWVRNLPDDTVEFVAEGEAARIDELIAWARRGPRMAVVTGLDLAWETPAGRFEPFRITR